MPDKNVFIYQKFIKKVQQENTLKIVNTFMIYSMCINIIVIIILFRDSLYPFVKKIKMGMDGGHICKVQASQTIFLRAAFFTALVVAS